MKYLVYASGGPGFSSPEEARQILEEIVLPTFEALDKLEKRNKILAGGMPVADRAFVFIAEAASHEELDLMLREIPLWGALQWEVTALQDWGARAAHERQVLQKLKTG
jgi:hypothetical protein